MPRSLAFKVLSEAYDKVEEWYYSGESTYEANDLKTINDAAELILDEDEFLDFVNNVVEE